LYGDKTKPPVIEITGKNGRQYKRTNLEYYLTKDEYTCFREEGKSLNDIVNIVGFKGDPRQFNKLLSKFGWNDGKKNFKRVIRNEVNENFFKTWTRESAWVYGWLLTDGLVDEKRSQIRLMLKSHDRDVLEKIRKAMNFSGVIRDGEHKDGRKFSYLRICRKEMVEDLFALGLARTDKTFNTSMPKLPENVFWDFIRGVFEGDGSIRHRTGNTDALDITICGATKSFIEDLQTALEKRGIFMRLSKNNSGVYTINTKSNADALRLCYFMYAGTDDGHRLSRKYNVYKNYINTYYDKVKRRSTQCIELVELARQNIA
jgi:LAGLIDADG-like domain